MWKKTKTLAEPASANTTSKSKAPVASGPNDQIKTARFVSEETIRIRARQKWEAAGKPNGEDLRFWFEAEREILQSN